MARLPRFWSRSRAKTKAVVITGRGARPARPGSAQPLQLKLIGHVPVLGRYARQRAEQRAAKLKAQQRLLSPTRWMRELRARNDQVLLAAEQRLPLLGPALRQVRKPLTQTARVVQAAREVRKPMTRWERLREAAWLAIEEPSAASRWEHLVGLGLALASGGVDEPPEPASRWPRVLQRKHIKKAGSGKTRNRLGFRPRGDR
ncbi:MAG: hypothetical protein ACT4PG_12505 [Panacagrimonas sp.]